MKNKNKPHILRDNLMRLIFIIVSLIVVVPILWAILTSFKTSTEFLTDAWALPQSIHIQNYINAITEAHMGQYFGNSIFLTAFSLILLFFLVVPSSYALARFIFPFRKGINLLFMAGLFISANCIVVPLFILLKDMHMLDNLLALGVIYAATNLPFNVYLMTGFMKGIEKDYEEAASLDGCGYFQTLWKVVVPLCKPGLITVALFGFMGFWNEYILALTVLTSEGKRTLPVGLQNLMEVQRYATDWGAMFAGLVIVMIPTMIFYALVQKKLTDGVSMGGLKG